MTLEILVYSCRTSQAQYDFFHYLTMFGNHPGKVQKKKIRKKTVIDLLLFSMLDLLTNYTTLKNYKFSSTDTFLCIKRSNFALLQFQNKNKLRDFFITSRTLGRFPKASRKRINCSFKALAKL